MTSHAGVGALVITIEEEGQGLVELEELLELQQRLLIAGQQHPLLENLSCQEKILRRLGKLEEQRLRLLEELVRAGELRTPPARLRELARALPEPDRARVNALADSIRARAGAIRRLERRNRRLIESGRRCLEGFMRLVIGPPEQPLTYGPQADVPTEPRFFSGEA